MGQLKILAQIAHRGFNELGAIIRMGLLNQPLTYSLAKIATIRFHIRLLNNFQL